MATQSLGRGLSNREFFIQRWEQDISSVSEDIESAADRAPWQESATFGALEEVIAAYELDHDTLAVHLRTLDDSSWNHQAWLIEGRQEILLKDTAGGLLWIALFDEIHHRGQLSTYIRPMGGKVPSIYGPSASSGPGSSKLQTGARSTER